MKRKKLNEVKIGDTLYCIARGQNGSVDIVPLTVKNVITNGPIIDLGIYSKEAIIIKEKVPNSPEAEGQFVIDQYYRGDECFSSKYGIYTTYEEAYQDAIEELKEEHQNYQLELKNLVKREESVMNSLVSLLKSPKTSKSHENTESEDERIRKRIKYFINATSKGELEKYAIIKEDAIDWIEKQGEQKPAEWHREDEQNLNACLGYILDEFLRRWLTDVIHAKYDKPADTVEPKFHEGEWVVSPNGVYWHIDAIRDGRYQVSSDSGKSTEWSLDTNIYHRFTIQDAKDGDVLVASDGSIFILKDTIDGVCKHYVALTTYDVVKFNEGLEHYWETTSSVHPATKEQREKLEKAMADAGYTFDFEKKELKKIEQPKQEWSEEDESWFKEIELMCLNFSNDTGYRGKFFTWLKSFKDRVQPQNRWKPSDNQIKALKWVLQNIPYNIHKEEISGLLDQIKGL